jgi:hypothetical protein
VDKAAAIVRWNGWSHDEAPGISRVEIADTIGYCKGCASTTEIAKLPYLQEMQESGQRKKNFQALILKNLRVNFSVMHLCAEKQKHWKSSAPFYEMDSGQARPSVILQYGDQVAK